MQMVPVSPVNPAFPINGQQYTMQPVIVTPGWSMPYPGNMHQHSSHHSKKHKKKKKKKEKSDSESDNESEYFYMRVSGQHHSRGGGKSYEIQAPSHPQAVNQYVRDYNYNSGRQQGSNYSQTLQQYNQARAQYNAAMDQHYNGNPVEGPAVVRFVAPFDDPYNPGFYA